MQIRTTQFESAVQSLRRKPGLWHRVRTLALVAVATGSTSLVLSQSSANDGKWIQDATVRNVTVYHQMAVCNGETVVLLKFDNKNKAAVNISWNNMLEVADSKGVHKVAEPATSKKQLSIAPGIVAASTCSDEQMKSLVIRPVDIVPTHHVKVTNIEFKNLTVANL